MFVFLASCSAQDVFVGAPWPDDHSAVVVIADGAGTPVTAPLFMAPGEALTRSVASSPYRILVRTFDAAAVAPNGMPLSACRIAVGGDGHRLPRPSTAWTSTLVQPDDEGPIPLLREDPFADLDLRFVGCGPPERSCSDFSVDVLEIPMGFEPLTVAATDESHALVGGDVHQGPERRTMLARIEDDAVTVLPPDDRLVDFVAAIEWDGRGTFYGRNGDDDLFVLAHDGTSLPVPRPLKIEGVAAGRDGTVVAFDETKTFELLARGTIVVDRTDFPPLVRGVDIVTADRLLVRTAVAVHVYDAGVWQKELETVLVEKVNEVFGDEEMMGAVTNVEDVHLRDPVRRQWSTIERPFDAGNRLREVVTLRGGRFVAVGSQGLIVVWTGTQWCDLSTPERHRFRDVDAAASGRVAWAVANANGEVGPAIVRINAPDPVVP